MASVARRRFLLAAVVVEGGMALVALACAALRGRPLFAEGDAAPGAIVLGVVFTLPLLMAYFAARRAKWTEVFGPLDEIVARLVRGLTAPDLLAVSLLAGFGEEMLFRGILQDGLLPTLGPFGALVAASAVFGALHWVTRTYALLAGVVGLYLGVLYFATKNLLIPVVVHALYDFVLLLDLRRHGKTSPERPTIERMKHRPSGEIPFEPVAAGSGAKRQVLVGPDDGAVHCALRRFVMEAGGGMPLHTNAVEHLQYVLAGEAEVRIGDETIRARPGDSIYIPAETPHSYRVLSETPFEFLCVVPNLPDSPRLLEDEVEAGYAEGGQK